MNIATLLKDYFADNKAALASAAGVSRQAVSRWDLNETVRAEYVRPICAFLDWRISPNVLRADLYPNPDDALPPQVPTPSLAQERRRHDQRMGDRRAPDCCAAVNDETAA